MKIALFFVTLLVSSLSFAKTSTIVHTDDFQIVADVETESNSLTFRNLRIVTDGSSYKVSSSQELREMINAVCESTPFKFLYVSNAHAGFFGTKTATIDEDGKVIIERTETEVVMMACTLNDY